MEQPTRLGDLDDHFSTCYRVPDRGSRWDEHPPEPIPTADGLEQEGKVIAVPWEDRVVLNIPGLGLRSVGGHVLRELAAAVPGPQHAAPDVASVTIGLSGRMVEGLDRLVATGLAGADRADAVRRIVERALREDQTGRLKP